MMIRVYTKHKELYEPEVPEAFLIQTEEERKKIYNEISDEIINNWFGNSKSLSKDDFIN